MPENETARPENNLQEICVSVSIWVPSVRRRNRDGIRKPEAARPEAV